MSDYGDYDKLGDRQSESSADLWLKIEARVKADRSELLIGLDTWLQLGLISQAQVIKIARKYLSCSLPIEQVVIPKPAVETDPRTKVLVPATPNPWQRVWQSFLDELSIRWLLFLGVFLVIVSSGVLAASQWQNFPDYGQYLVLWLYSLGFWGIGFWTGRQEGLKLTAQTLSAIATLLIPINFWAISHLGLLSQPLGWGIVALAAISLTATRYFTLPKQSNNIAAGLFLLLSYLHLGWQIPGLSLISIYGGIGIVIGLHYQRLLPRRKYPLVDLLYVLTAWLLLLARELIPTFIPHYSLAIALFAWSICTIYLSQTRQTKLVALQHKSLAISHSLLGKIVKILALILFLVTWWVSLQAGIRQSSLFFWQNVAISCLGIQLFYQRLSFYWQKRDLTAIFILGLQTLYLCKELIPNSFRARALDLSVEISNSAYFPESVLGVSLFPYLILFIWIASWLYRQQKKQLGIWAEYLTLILGIVFTCLSWTNPTWRSLNLLFSTLTLGYVTYIRLPIRNGLIYATHLLGLITVINAIAVIFPSLNTSWWGSICIALMTINWGNCLIYRQSNSHISATVNRSCWYVGLFLSALSYTCFLADRTSAWGLVWFISPIMATLIGKYTHKISQRRLATVISCLALILGQILVYEQGETRIIGLAIATVLMLLNAFNLRRLSVTAIHLGFAIALFASLFDLFIDRSLANYQQWLLIGCMAILILYQLRLSLLKTSNTTKFGYISQRTASGILGVGRETKNFKLIDRYIKAADYWAIALISIELFVISIVYFLLPRIAIDGRFLFYLLATGLLTTTIVWRYRAKVKGSEINLLGQPNNLVLYALTWLTGVFISGLVRLISSSTLILATSNILLGFAALVVVVLLAQSDTPWAKLNLVFIPLVYATLGIFWRLSSFNAYTGLVTIGAAIILLSVQPTGRIGRITKYLGFAAISAGIYELVIYQMQSSSGGSPADALTILSLVAAAIAFSYRLAVSWQGKSSATIFSFSLARLTLIAHLHWAISSILKIIAAGIAIESNTPRLTLVSIATSFCLGAYAVIQGRDSNISNSDRDTASQNDWWVYVGLVEIAATLVYSRLIITRLSLFDPWRIIFTCAIALLIYQIPWQNFGWRSTPWQRVAIAIPALMALIMAEDISYLSLLVTALFYVRIAYAQRNIRWSYISLGLLNWLSLRAIGEYSLESIWVAGTISLSILYIAQFDPDLKSQRQQRHYLRLVGSNIFCLTALFQYPGIISGAFAFGFVLLGLGLRIRALLFTGTIALVLTVIHQLIILVFTYSFLKWVVGLLAGIASIAIAAGFETKRDRLDHKLKTYQDKLRNWQ